MSQLPAATLRLVLLVSCAHSLVHVYEQTLPSVEQAIAAEYFPDEVEAGKRFSGRLSNGWRFLWGVGALGAGWLVDRYGSNRLLAVYLLGCGGTCVAAGWAQTQSLLAATMLAMGACASIYHPAGLTLISHETTAGERPRAHGIHGVFGSAGIGLAPLLAGTLFAWQLGWRQIYGLLAIPGFVLGTIFLLRLGRDRPAASHAAASGSAETRWSRFFTLTVLAALQGFVYSALLSFLPRYLSQWRIAGTDPVEFGNYAAGAVLWVGCIGQYLGGRIARPETLERQLTIVVTASAPALAWMAFAQSWDRVASASLFALTHFGYQPVYNTLIAKYTPPHRRSLCYGFSFAMGLGIGSFGAGFAGSFGSDRIVYGTLAVISLVAAMLGTYLWRSAR